MPSIWAGFSLRYGLPPELAAIVKAGEADMTSQSAMKILEVERDRF